MESNDSLAAKHHSQEADELDELCRKLSDVRVQRSPKSQGPGHAAAAGNPKLYSTSAVANGDHAVFPDSGLDCEDEDEDRVRLCDVSVERMAIMIQSLRQRSTNPARHRHAVIQFRKLLAHSDIHPFLDRIVETGIIPCFAELVDRHGNPDPQLQFEAAWILTNIAAGTSVQTQSVVDSGAVPRLVELVSHSIHKEIQEQSVWCLGNIAGDGVVLRSVVLQAQALEPLVRLITREMNDFLSSTSHVIQPPTYLTSVGTTIAAPLKSSFNLSTLRIAIWALSNFCRGNGRCELDWNLIHVAIPILAEVISCCSPHSPHHDDEILMDASWALSRTLRGIHEGVDAVIVSKDLCCQIGKLIVYDRSEVQIPALRCLINVVSGSDAQTQMVLEADLLPVLHYLLVNAPDETIRKETCLILSNIAAGPESHVEAMLKLTPLLDTLMEYLRGNPEHAATMRVRKEVCWALGNAFLARIPAHIQACVDRGLIGGLMDFVFQSFENEKNGADKLMDEKVMVKAMEAITNILQCGRLLGQAGITFAPSNEHDHLMMQMKCLKIEDAQLKIHEQDSAYSSSTNLVADNGLTNPYVNHFYKEPLSRHSSLKGIHVLTLLAESGNQGASEWYGIVPKAIRSIAQNLMQHYFY